MLVHKQQVAAGRPRVVAAASVPARLRAVAVRASSTEEQPSAAAPPPTTVDFMPNTQAASGYVEFDTAGQSNMYPVITRAYEAGSDQDTASTGSANLVIGLGAGVIAVAVFVLAVGLGALTQQQAAPPAETVEQFKSLSEYAAAFAAEL